MSKREGPERFDAAAFIQHLKGTRVLPDDVVNDIYRALFAYWKRIAGRRAFPADLVEDAAHDAWLKMSQKINQLDDERRLGAWSNQIFLNCMHDLVAGRSREAVRDFAGDDVVVPVWTRASAGPEADLLEREEQRLFEERRRLVAGFVERLAGRKRAVWDLYLAGECSSGDVAATLGLSATRVRHIAHELKTALARVLGASPSPGVNDREPS